MAKAATFTSIWARCPNHQSRLLEEGEEVCFDCKIMQRNLSLTPPFDVLCTRDSYGVMKKGGIYTVVWVITSGREEHWNLKGYCFEAEDGSILPQVFDSTDFIPMDYLKDGKDTWLSQS